MRRTVTAFVVALFSVTFAPSARGSRIDNIGVPSQDVPRPVDEGRATIVEYTDFTSWSAAVGSLCENRYAELGNGVTVTTQYLPVGANYPEGDDVTMAYAKSTDGTILNAEGRVNITFSTPHTAIGVNFPGALRIVGYFGSNVVFTSSDFAGSGAFFFGGVVSSLQFNRVELIDWVDDDVFPDDVFYDGCGTVSVESESWGRIKATYR